MSPKHVMCHVIHCACLILPVSVWMWQVGSVLPPHRIRCVSNQNLVALSFWVHLQFVFGSCVFLVSGQQLFSQAVLCNQGRAMSIVMRNFWETTITTIMAIQIIYFHCSFQVQPSPSSHSPWFGIVGRCRPVATPNKPWRGHDANNGKTT